jgi:hypothetical protein
MMLLDSEETTDSVFSLWRRIPPHGVRRGVQRDLREGTGDKRQEALAHRRLLAPSVLTPWSLHANLPALDVCLDALGWRYEGRFTMYTVVRQYSSQGASQLFDALESKKDEVERLIRGVSGVVSYTLLRTSDGGISVTVCQEKAGADESVRVAADWVRQNAPVATSPPRISEGNTILHFTT